VLEITRRQKNTQKVQKEKREEEKTHGKPNDYILTDFHYIFLVTKYTNI
jgi:hypothetical protein